MNEITVPDELLLAFSRTFGGNVSQWMQDAEEVIRHLNLKPEDMPHMKWKIEPREESPNGCVRFAVNGVEMYVDPSDEGPCLPRLWDSDDAIVVGQPSP